MLDFRILGPFEVFEERAPIALGGPRQRALLGVLLLRRGEVVSSDRLIDQLWGERPPATAAKTLQGYVSHLRKALGSEVLLTRGGGYVLDVAPGQVDAERFATLVAEARGTLAGGDAAGARKGLDVALALWRGEAFADLAYEPFAQGEIARLEEARLAAQEDRIEAALMLGEHRGAVGELEALVGKHPHRERLRGQLMLALYRSGRHADALDTYRRGRDALGEELGLEPGPELRALEQRILTHDPGLDAPIRTAAAPTVAGSSPGRRGRALIAAGGVVLLAAAIAAVIAALAGGGVAGVRVRANSVAAIDTHTNRVVAQVAVGSRPDAIAFGSGSLWVANLDDQTVSRVDPETLQTLRTIPLGDPPTGIATGDGWVWIVESSPTSTFVSASRIDPQFDAIDDTVRIGNVAPDTPPAVAARGNTLWVAPLSGELTRLDPGSGRVTDQIDPNAGPTGIDIGEGAVWVTDSSADTVTRVDPTGLLTPIPVGHGASGIAVGDDGVWVADPGDDAVVRVDPSTRAVTTTIPVGQAPAGVAVGAGSVWVANSGDGTVTRINPATDKVTATITVGGSPQQVTVAHGRAWVTVAAPTIPTSRLAAAGGTARLDSAMDVDYMDPALAYSPWSWELLYATCAKLLNYPDKSGLAGAELVPEVAQSLPARSADGKTYTFTIRPGFRFSPPSNGPVTAQTFKDTIERTLNPRMKNPVASEFDDIVGARAYMAGKAAHISGVTARGNTLTVRLTAPAPDLPARLAQPFFCAVPPDTPIDPSGVRVIPSAGPYTVSSYAPGQGVVLTRNPNYHGSRPHHLARIEMSVGIPSGRAISQVEHGSADYAMDGEITSPGVAAALAARYGPGSPAAKRGDQQYFVAPARTVDFLALNTHRPLFSDLRMRQAVNYAIDRTALARLGAGDLTLPGQPTDNYIPPDVPGYRDVHIYSLTPDLTKARALARGHAKSTAVLWTCDVAPCPEQAQVITTDLAAIGIRVQTVTFPIATLFPKIARPGAPFDIAWEPWEADYPDPDAILNLLLEGGESIPTFADPSYRARLAAAAQLTGAERYLAYARLDADLVRAAPWAAVANSSTHELFSARMGCQTYGVYGLDLAALCIRKVTR